MKVRVRSSNRENNDNADPIDWMTAWHGLLFVCPLLKTATPPSIYHRASRRMFPPPPVPTLCHLFLDRSRLFLRVERTRSCSTQIAASGAADEAPAITGRLSLRNAAAGIWEECCTSSPIKAPDRHHPLFWFLVSRRSGFFFPSFCPSFFLPSVGTRRYLNHQPGPICQEIEKLPRFIHVLLLLL